MKFIVGDEFGILKCVDAQKKILESKYGEIKKNNSVISIKKLTENNNNLLSVLNEQRFYILDWNTKEEKLTEELKLEGKFNSMVTKHTADFS
jgi:hypothetical protein